jgi:hypothetical protein
MFSASSVRKYFQIKHVGNAAYGTMGKAPLATECAGRNPTDREKGRKRSLLVDGYFRFTANRACARS